MTGGGELRRRPTRRAAALATTLTALGLSPLSGCLDGEPISDDAEVEAGTQEVLAAPPLPAQVTSRYVVTLRSDAADAGAVADHLTRAHGGQRRHVYRGGAKGFSVVNLPPGAVEALRRDPAVKRVVEDRQMKADTTQLSPGWGLDRMDDSHGLDNSFDFFFDGKGTHIYIVDSGIRGDHIDLADRLGVGVNVFDSSSAYAAATYFHGTAVASAAGGATAGVARGATLHAVKITDTNTAWLSDMIDGIEWVADHAIQPAVLNLSFEGDDSSVVDALEYAVSKGIVVVKAAGNNGVEACNDDTGNTAQGVIIVGATNSADQRASFSDYGPCVGIFAPGAGVRVATNSSSTAFASGSGTSFAAPYVAGIGAALLAQGVPAFQVFAGIGTSAWQGQLTNLGAGSPNLLANSQHTYATLKGPSQVDSGYASEPTSTQTWTADTSGGNKVWTFKWEREQFGFYNVVGTGQSLTLSIVSGSNYSMNLRLTATSSGKTTVSTRHVTVKSEDSSSCLLPGC
jgi:subtilisin family serine protease